MCLLVVAWRVHPRYPLVVAANRDEFHARPAQALAPWTEPAPLLAGRDLQAGGTWLGVDPARRFGVITNFREPVRASPTAPSRGRLVVDYLAGALSAWDYAQAMAKDAPRYAGFSLLLADGADLVYASNRVGAFAQRLPPGIYGLSNHLLDTPWPKLLKVRTAMTRWVESRRPELDPLWSALADPEIPSSPADADPLPADIDPAWAPVLAPPFVRHPAYGTRCSTLSLIADNGDLRMAERRFDPAGLPAGETQFECAGGRWLA